MLFRTHAEFALPYLAQIASRVKTALREAGVKSQITTHSVLDAAAPAVEDDDIPITCFPRRTSNSILASECRGIIISFYAYVCVF